jgi:hypothetical protein
MTFYKTKGIAQSSVLSLLRTPLYMTESNINLGFVSVIPARDYVNVSSDLLLKSVCAPGSA